MIGDTLQPFTTHAELNEDEVKKVEAILRSMELDGEIVNPAVYEYPEFVPQTYEQVLNEINEAVGGEYHIA